MSDTLTNYTPPPLADGDQSCYRIGYYFRARAIRRVYVRKAT